METSEVQKFNLKNFLSSKGAAPLASTVAVIGIGALAFSDSVADGDKIVLGVRAEGQPLGGLDRTAAEKFFNTVAAQKIHDLTFRCDGEEFVVTPAEIGLTPLVDKAAQEAFSYGRGGSTVGNFNDQIKCILNGRNVKLTAAYDAALLEEKLNDIAAKVQRDPVNALCRFSSGTVIEKVPGVIGKRLNVTELAESLREPLTTLNLPKGAIDLKLEVLSGNPVVRQYFPHRGNHFIRALLGFQGVPVADVHADVHHGGIGRHQDISFSGNCDLRIRQGCGA